MESGVVTILSSILLLTLGVAFLVGLERACQVVERWAGHRSVPPGEEEDDDV